jgi:YHS domain-containing protein
MRRVLACGLTMMTLAAAVAAEDEIPAPFARFEPMVGAWKGTARPAENRVRGWQEKHAWAWKFIKGTPVGMTLAIEGGKVFTKGELTFDPKTSRYTLTATDPPGKPVSFTGAPTADNKALVLERTTPEGKERLSIQSAGGGIRYVMKLDRQAVGAPQFKNAIEVGLTKEGESFAAGGEAANLPKCILTDGAATLSVTFNGKSYPVCCTGCRDEFNENPEKYVARAEAKAAAGGSEKPATAAKPAAPSRGASEFEGLVDEPKAMPKSSAKKAATLDAEETKPAAKAATPKAGTAEAKAASDLRLGQAFERAGKADRALDTYKALVKKYPDTDAARTGADRIKALDK